MYTAETSWARSPQALPEGVVVFAIGDIHGHADELAALQERIALEIQCSRDHAASVVYLGDYIDRGPAVARTLDLLLAAAEHQDGVERMFLVGNHDQFLVEVLKCSPDLDRQFFTAWFDNGGEITLESLGVTGYGPLIQRREFASLSARVRAALGEGRTAFLLNLSVYHRIGDYVFVHAGLDPTLALEEQDFVDMLMIREPFLSAPQGWPHPFRVVHGHSVSTLAMLPHRIGVDAGCYRTGCLCAVQIEARGCRFLGVARERGEFASVEADIPWINMVGLAEIHPTG